jgi:N-acetyl-alpha-D-muramate 1-phosphate uridylyltransferase
MITQGIILAAGLGARMRPLSNDIPKPMVQIHGKPIIQYAIEALQNHGVTTIVVNTHYKAEVLEQYLKQFPNIIISHEPVLLDTGGGIKQALTYLDTTQPVFVLAGDSILIDAPEITTLKQLENAWYEQDADLLLSLQPLATMHLTKGVGDYTIKNNNPIRTPDHTGNYMWNSARILQPSIFENTPDTPFSFLKIMDATQNKNRLSASIHNGLWHHLTTPDDIEAVHKGWSP